MSWTHHRTLNWNVNWNDRKKNILDCNSKRFNSYTTRTDYLSVSSFPSCKPASHGLAPFQRLCRLKALIEVANRFYSQLHNKIQMSRALINVFQCHNVLMLDPEKNRWNIWSITANQSCTWVDYEGFVFGWLKLVPVHHSICSGLVCWAILFMQMMKTKEIPKCNSLNNDSIILTTASPIQLQAAAFLLPNVLPWQPRTCTRPQRAVNREVCGGGHMNHLYGL